MKASLSAALLAALAGTSAARDATVFNADTLLADSAPNAISMETLKERKMVQREGDVADGVFDVDRYRQPARRTASAARRTGTHATRSTYSASCATRTPAAAPAKGTTSGVRCLNEPHVVSL